MPDIGRETEIYKRETRQTRDRARWLRNGEALLRERGHTVKADRIGTAAQLVESAARILETDPFPPRENA
jgi:Tfp pilus assembly protein PilX